MKHTDMPSTKTQLLLQEGEIKTFKLEVIVLGVIATIGSIAPFIHIFYIKSGIEGIFGFPTMESFWYAAGFPIMVICYGLILHHVSDRLGDLEKPFKLISHLALCVGFYFIVWIFIPSISDFPSWAYYIAIVLIAIVCSVFTIWLYGFIPSSDKLEKINRSS
ncbi:hypothetical protein [Zhouia amylolytica]|nr:hypothetical protein [Zhouia amylolytica]MCQ0111982.1 hypothetical protein [Zhouia amylolytica]